MAQIESEVSAGFVPFGANHTCMSRVENDSLAGDETRRRSTNGDRPSSRVFHKTGLISSCVCILSCTVQVAL